MSIIAIDGACRRNGKPSCVSVGSAYIVGNATLPYVEVDTESGSTNQRGELLGLILGLQAGLRCLKELDSTVYLITDSEYIYNTITKEWYKSWAAKGWVTSMGTDVKNQDLWEKVALLIDLYDGKDQLVVYHLKGHLITIGKATATRLYQADKECRILKADLEERFEVLIKDDPSLRIQYAIQVFERNHGFAPPANFLRTAVIANTIADIAAGVHADSIDDYLG